jgi:uncharacterized small protein (DUF1192 family)
MPSTPPIPQDLKQLYDDRRGYLLPHPFLMTVGELIERIARLEQETAALREWKKSVSGAIKCIPEFATGKWSGDKDGWGFHFEVVQWIRREKERLEAQLARHRAPVSDKELDKFVVVRTQIGPNEQRLDCWRSSLDALIADRGKEQKDAIKCSL